MNVMPIKTEADYRAALARIETLMSAEFGSPEGDELDVLATLVEAYETKNFPINLPSPIAAIIFKMEQTSLSVKDLEPAIGKSNRVYEVLNGTRALTLPMIQNLHRIFGIPAASLIAPQRVVRARASTRKPRSIASRP